MRRFLLPILMLLVALSLVPTLPTQPAQAAVSTTSLQRALADKGLYRGPIDGKYGAKTQNAVMAFRKEIGVARSYSWSDSLWDDLMIYQAPYTRFDEPDRVEINLAKQTAHLFVDGKLKATFPISSGSGEIFLNYSGNPVRAVTPTGDYKVFRREYGWYTSYLGEMLNPWFFNGGIAIHGSTSVPPYPASHGCVRLTIWDSDYINHYMFMGMPVHVYASNESPVYGSDGPFADVPADHTFVDAVQWMVDNEYTSGCSKYFYCPGDPVTRGQMAAFFNRVLDLNSASEDYFVDDNSSIFEGDINAIAADGITRGCNPPTNNEYCPEKSVTRGQMAAFIRRALGLPVATIDYFSDDNGSVYESDINAIAAAGITQGCGPDSFCPGAKVTRGEMAAFLYRIAG